MAINGNVCLCETNEEGSGRLCRRCGLERQASKAKVESWWRDWINSSFDHQSSAAANATGGAAAATGVSHPSGKGVFLYSFFEGGLGLKCYFLHQ